MDYCLFLKSIFGTPFHFYSTVDIENVYFCIPISCHHKDYRFYFEKWYTLGHNKPVHQHQPYIENIFNFI